MNKNMLITLILTAFFTVSLSAANLPQPYYVDINEANSEIDILESNSAKLGSDNEEIQAESVTLKNDIKAIYATISQIDDLLEEVIKASGDLYNHMNTISDSEQKSKLSESVNNNRKQRYDLENKKAELLNAIEVKDDLLDSQSKIFARNNLLISRNAYRVDFLKSCIELSVSDAQPVETSVQKISELQMEVDKLLSKHIN